MWVGSFAEYDGMKPDIVFKYDGERTFQQKVDGLNANLDATDGTRYSVIVRVALIWCSTFPHSTYHILHIILSDH